MFIREFSQSQIDKMTSGSSAELFSLLKHDVLRGEVFPAVRKNELHFYYKGGCLYKFTQGSFKRDKNFEKFGGGLEDLEPYERAKAEVERKFKKTDGNISERMLLNRLNKHTYGDIKSDVVVLDIEVNLNGLSHCKKCDTVLLNKRTDEIMFVEGKVFSDERVLVAVSFTPRVISQVNTYTAAIAEQHQNILDQYARHIDIVNALFGSSFRAPQKIIEPAKLLVYGTPIKRNVNAEYSIDKINAELGSGNVLWLHSGDASLEEIWRALS